MYKKTTNKDRVLSPIDFVIGGELLPQYKDVPWKAIKGIRNLLAHEYLSV